MKKSICCLYLSLFIYSAIFAQVTRSGSFVANLPGSYPISGDVTLENNAGTITVHFASNFATIQGITLEVFLAKTSTLNLSTDVKISDAPLDAGSPMNTPITGPITFNVPSGVNAFDFDNVLVQCTSANLLWGHANLCKEDMDISIANLPSDNYRAEKTISSELALDNSTTISFETSNTIYLNPGFDVPASTEFTTLLGLGFGCVIE